MSEPCYACNGTGDKEYTTMSGGIGRMDCPVCRKEESVNDKTKPLDLEYCQIIADEMHDLRHYNTEETIESLIKEVERLREDKEQLKGCWDAEAEWHVDHYEKLEKENAKLREEVDRLQVYELDHFKSGKQML